MVARGPVSHFPALPRCAVVPFSEPGERKETLTRDEVRYLERCGVRFGAAE